MSVYKKTMVGELVKGNIILHPIFRSDGFLFIKRYKKLSNSVLAHLRLKIPTSLEVLSVSTEIELEQFLEKEEYVDEKFLTDLMDIVNQFNQTYNVKNIDISSFHDERVNNSELQKIFQKENNVHEFISSPLWKQLHYLYDSESILQRGTRIKEMINDSLLKDESLKSMFQKMKAYHDVLVVHSINTAIISFMIGLSLELSDEDLVDLTIASLFCYIGFIKCSHDEFIYYLNHGRKQDLLRNHIKNTVEIMALSPYSRRRNILLGVYDHHEQYDGKGEPLQKKGKEIHTFGRIIGIAQGYDEVVGGYLEEKSLSSLEAIVEIWLQRGKKYDPDIIDIFFRRITQFKIGQNILLSDFRKAEIIGFTDYIQWPIFPIVRLTDGTILNLYRNNIEDN